MNRFLLKIFFEKFKCKKLNDGFTLFELIISSSISLIVLTTGYYLSKTVSQYNKNDKTQIELFSKVDGTFDFIIDEINSGNRIISIKDKIPTSCLVPEGNFILGISLPTQASDSSAYQLGSGSGTSWSKIDCPVIYYLKNPSSSSSNKITHELWRYGPSIDEKGFYQSISFSESLITDQISNQPLNEIKCSDGWTKKNIKGISICFDSYSRTAEINVTSNEKKFLNKDLFVTKTSAGSNRIQDDLLMGINNGSDNDENSDNICSNLDTCNLFGTKIVGNITFLIDVSTSMNNYLFRKNKTRLEAVKEELIKLISNLSNIEFQVISFGSFDTKLWDKAKPATENNKSEAINWVIKLTAQQLQTNPMESLMKVIEDPSTKQAIILSDGLPTKQYWEYSAGVRYCDHTGYYESIDSCVSSYNISKRSDLGTASVKIDAISIPSYQRCGRRRYCEFQYCEASLNPITYRPLDNWMGRLSSSNGGKCSVIK